MNIKQAKELLKYMLRRAIAGKPVQAIHFIGGPGCGKSQIHEQAVAEVAAEIGQSVDLLTMILSTVEQPDVRGYLMPGKDAQGRLVSQFTLPPLALGLDAAQYGIEFLDEFDQASADVRKAASEFILNRRIGDYQLPPGWIVTSASNRESDRSGVGKSLAFLDNRRIIIYITAMLNPWVEWAESQGVHPLAIAFAKIRPGLVFQDKVPDKPGPFCTPRTLCMMAQHIDQLQPEMFMEVAMGLIGEGTAAEFTAFLRVASELPSYEEIIANPEKVPVPSKPDAQYAAMQLIAHRVDPKTAPKAFKYLTRMPEEFQVAGLKATFRKTPQMLQSTEFAEWARNNRKLVLAAAAVDNR